MRSSNKNKSQKITRIKIIIKTLIIIKLWQKMSSINNLMIKRVESQLKEYSFLERLATWVVNTFSDLKLSYWKSNLWLSIIANLFMDITLNLKDIITRNLKKWSIAINGEKLWFELLKPLALDLNITSLTKSIT